jgi:hypothetical protein
MKEAVVMTASETTVVAPEMEMCAGTNFSLIFEGLVFTRAVT